MPVSQFRWLVDCPIAGSTRFREGLSTNRESAHELFWSRSCCHWFSRHVGQLARPVSQLTHPVSQLARTISQIAHPVSQLAHPVSQLAYPVSRQTAPLSGHWVIL